MTQMELIQQRLLQLPPGKQGEVLDFIASLQQRLTAAQQHVKQRSLRQHPAFGSWSGRKIDALDYQCELRQEWDERV